MTTRARRRPQLFEPDELFTPEQAAERLKVTPKQVRRAVYEERINPEGVTAVARGRRIWGWALNEFVESRTLG